MASVSLQNVSKIYGSSVRALQSTSLQIQDKEFVVLVGPSGCGKTTILRLISGLDEVSSGDIYINSKRINDLPPKDRDLAMVFQNYALYPHMNVFENIAFGLKLRKVPKPEIKRRVEEVSRLLELEGLLLRKPRELSGGQKQRVAMGRAIVREPKVFLMDEPLSNLDAQLRVQMRVELQKLHQRLGITTIYVTHDQTEAMTLGSRIVVMKEGQVQQINTPLQLYEKPLNTFVAGFIGNPPMNLLPAKVVVRENQIYLTIDRFDLTVPKEKESKLRPYKDQEIIFGIRPEDIRISTGSTNALQAQVEIAELLGSEAYLHLRTGQANLLAKVGPHTHPSPGSEIGITLDMQRMHAFDPHTGITLQ